MEPMTLAFTLMLVALALFVADIFIPSHGLLSMLGVAALLGAVGIGFHQGIRQGAMIVTIIGLATPLLLYAAVKWWPHTPVGRLIILRGPSDPEAVLPPQDPTLEALIGKIGRARGDMLPGGSVVVAGRSWDALSDGKPIDGGTPVKVIAIRMGRLVVRAATPEDLAQAREDEAETLLSQPVDWEWDEDDPGASA